MVRPLIFLSYKHTQQAAVRRVRRRLELHAGNSLEFVSAEDVKPGEEWRAWIHKTLPQCALLFLFYTEPGCSFEWCMYETGLFTSAINHPRKPVICFYQEHSHPPHPIADMLAVPCTIEGVKAFLRRFFGTTNMLPLDSPINPVLAESEEYLDDIARFICKQLIWRPSATVHYNRRIKLTVEDPEKLGESIPKDAMVEADQLSLDLFGLIDQGHPRPWSELENMIRHTGQEAFLDELAVAIAAAARGEVIKPIKNKLISIASSKTYQPNVHKRDKSPDGTMNFEILFIHQPNADEFTLPFNGEGD